LVVPTLLKSSGKSLLTVNSLSGISNFQSLSFHLFQNPFHNTSFIPFNPFLTVSAVVQIALANSHITLGEALNIQATTAGVKILQAAPYQRTQPLTTHCSHLGIISFNAAQASADFKSIPLDSSNNSNASFLNARLSFNV